MNLLIVGSGRGSWEVRGQQLGAALGARVLRTPSAEDLRWADAVVLVKRAGLVWAAKVHAAGRPIVWDALDCWNQPVQHRLGEADAIRWLQALRDQIRPALAIGATECMAAALGGVCLPHHAWTGLRPAPARDVVQTVAYQGNPAYLGQWIPRLQRACARRGWAFVLNPSQLTDADLLVSLRDGVWDGWMPRHWKSGVKIVNAIAAGRPVLVQDGCAAFDELDADGAVLADDGRDLEAVLDFWADPVPRQQVVERARVLAPAYDVQAVSARYRQLLAQAAEAVAA
jgi:glycosyltransferase involved in cell wall biosynthesis